MHHLLLGSKQTHLHLGHAVACRPTHIYTHALTYTYTQRHFFLFPFAACDVSISTWGLDACQFLGKHFHLATQVCIAHTVWMARS